MQSALKNAPSILERIAKRGCVLLLDFDGVLAPIVPRYADARISARTRRLVVRAAKRYPTAVVSGRSISDVRSRAGISGVTYIGCHGLEERYAGGVTKRFVAARALVEYRCARDILCDICKRYPTLVVEDKGLSFALHYRSLPARERRALRREAQAAVARFVRGGAVRVIDHLCAFDLVPRPGVTKGTAARKFARRHRAAMPVYIGDSLTDEDAFRALHRGITIRVGKSASSAARYYVASRKDVDRFLTRLAKPLQAARRP